MDSMTVPILSQARSAYGEAASFCHGRLEEEKSHGIRILE
jgi:hypothetical protein